MKDIENIKCPNCGTILVKGTKKCVKCKLNINSEKKSCPKCAKVNEINAKKCISCGFNFNQKRPTIIFNAIISILLVICLFLLVNSENAPSLKSLNIIFKLLAALFIIFLIYKNVNYGYKDIIKYGESEEIKKGEIPNKIAKMKKISNIFIIIAGIIILAILIFYYFVKR